MNVIEAELLNEFVHNGVGCLQWLLKASNLFFWGIHLHGVFLLFLLLLFFILL